MSKITDEIILQDIADFKNRIHKAEDKLKKLPRGYLPLKEHKKREKARRILEGELKHIQNLTHIAEESLIDV